MCPAFTIASATITSPLAFSRALPHSRQPYLPSPPSRPPPFARSTLIGFTSSHSPSNRPIADRADDRATLVGIRDHQAKVSHAPDRPSVVVSCQQRRSHTACRPALPAPMSPWRDPTATTSGLTRICRDRAVDDGAVHRFDRVVTVWYSPTSRLLSSRRRT